MQLDIGPQSDCVRTADAENKSQASSKLASDPALRKFE